MKYQIGQTARVVVARFEDGDNVLKSLIEVARNEDIRAGVFYLIGGMRNCKIVVGPEKDQMPPVPVWRELSESQEVVGLGTIFWDSENPRVHFHGAFGKRDNVKVGCLREMAETFLVLEAVIVEIKGINAHRELDPASGLVLLKL
jgi:predicted DNA-binding protein with PD1-like motif